MRALVATDCRARGSRRDDGVVDPSTGEAETGRDVLPFEIGQLLENLFRSQARRQQVQDIGDANAQPRTHGRPPHWTESTVMRSASQARRVAVPRARAKGIFTDEDVFALIS